MNKKFKQWTACWLAVTMLFLCVPVMASAAPEESAAGEEAAWQVQAYEPEEEAMDSEEFSGETSEEEVNADMASAAPAAQLAAVTDEDLDSVIYDFQDTTDITNLSDEEFYGKYNSVTGEWENPGYFDYDKYPEMLEVKEAVMRADGDYSEVKQAVFDYFAAKKEKMNLGVPSAQNAQSRFLAYTMNHNLYFHPTWKMLGSAMVNGTDQYISFDVSPLWDEIKISADKMVSFYLMAYRKDGNEAVFASKEEGAHPPILEVESNGVVTTLIASDDATVSAGGNAAKNYGSESTLRVEESVSSIGAAQPMDANTKRAHLKFDLSPLSLNSNISRVTLKLYGKNATSNDEKEVLAFKVPTNSWKENKITFRSIDGNNSNKYENMAYSWDGEKYLRFIMPDYCGYRYREEQDRFETWFFRFVANYIHASGDKEYYAGIALRQWVGWLEQTGKDAKGNPAYRHNLDLGCRLIAMPVDLIRLFESKYMTPEIWSATLKYMWKSEYEIAYNNYLINMTNNTGIVGARALHNGNCFFNEFRIYDDALERVRKKMDWVMSSTLIGKDGSYEEDSIAYAAMTAGNTLGYLQSNRITGNPDLPFRNEEQFDSARVIIRSIINLAAPGMRDNQWGDSSEVTTTYYTNIKEAYEEFDDPVIAYFATEGREVEPPPYTSYRYNDTKRIVMRSDWGDNAVYLFSDVGGSNAHHGHNDDNAIILFAYGRQLLSDQLYYSYSTGAVKNYIESATAHNTVTVDEKNQRNTSRGEINFWETNSIYDNSSNVTKTNPDALHTRNILYLRSGFILVSDYMNPTSKNASHTYQQLWHMPPDANITLDDVSLKGRSNILADANVQVVPVNDDSMTGSIRNGYYVATTADYLRYEKAGIGPVTFDTVLYPEKPGQTAEISTEKVELENVENNGAAASHISIEPDQGESSDIYYYLVHDPKMQAVRQFGNYETDARLAYVERDSRGNLAQLVIQDGTYIKDLSKDKMLFQSEEKVEQLGARIEYGSVELASSKNVDLTKCTFRADTNAKISSLKWNTENHDFKLSGKYVYFGSTPIIDESDEPTETPKPDRKPGNSGGGGNNRPGGGTSSGMGGSTAKQPSVPVQPTPPAQTEGPQAPEGPFEKELKDYWGKEEIKYLIDHELMRGMDDGTLKLEQNVTRAEFAALLSRAMGWKAEEYRSGTFVDVAENDWFAGVVQAAYNSGIITGNQNKEFCPNDFITREEMAKMLALTCELHAKETGEALPEVVHTEYADGAVISNWALEYIDKAGSYGLMQGREDSGFAPRANATRGEAGVVIYRLLCPDA
ncbi:MAG: S-layer homology domain-containing protein [Clostridia bacterium]|nr:S-layer homology domain-containing protein [Clostridia bacterium]